MAGLNEMRGGALMEGVENRRDVATGDSKESLNVVGGETVKKIRGDGFL